MVFSIRGKDYKMQIQIPENAEKIIDILMSHGYEAYVVGGCVRDSILNKKPMDWDITTSASPIEIKELFQRTVDTGIQHGTVTVLMGKEAYEVTTYRLDGEYEDHRRPKEVIFTKSLEEDLKRRDFTINAMAYNEKEGLQDLFSGEEDLEKGVIRCVGVPEERFDEDALRILRAVRFSAQLNFTIEEGTKNAIRTRYPHLKDISAERIQVELTKLLTSNHPEKLLDAKELGITSVVLPEFDRMVETEQNNPHHCYNVGVHSLKAVKYIEADPILRWTMLLHDVAKPLKKETDEKGIDHFHGHDKEGVLVAKAILKRMKLDNHTIDTACKLIQYHDYRFHYPVSDKEVRKMMNKIGVELFPALLKVQRADALAQSEYRRERKMLVLDSVEKAYEEVIEKKQCVTMKELAVNGRDLMSVGIESGAFMGTVLKELLEIVLDDPTRNEKEQLLQIVKEQYRKQ